MSLEGRNIVVVVTGGIAAYKAADLVSRLRKGGAEVRVAMTSSAKKFVAPLTFEALSGHRVYDRMFDDERSFEMEHIGWARWADAIVVAPATADFLAKMAQGIADDPALTLYLAYEGQVWVAPAMNTKMWEHAATQANVATLAERKVKILAPGSGALACGEVGEGRMSEPAQIVEAVTQDMSEGDGGESNTDSIPGAELPLAGKKVLITAGPTREPLDPIRFISNRSTGQMGVALAKGALRLGAEVCLIHGPMSAPIPAGVRSIPADTCAAMLEAVQENIGGCRVAIFAAAVANYGASSIEGGKIKGGDTLELKLDRTPDIAAWAGHHRNGEKQLLVGFAAESENLIEAAQEKLRKKKLDLIFANPIGVAGVGFEADSNVVTMLDKSDERVASEKMKKSELGEWIWERILERV